MLRCFVLLLVLGGLLPTRLPAQPAADSLRRLLAAHPREDTVRVRRLNALVSELLVSDVAKALRVAQQACTLARRLADSHGELQALISLSAVYRLQNESDQARRYAKQARYLAAQRHDRGSEAKALLQLGFLDMFLGNSTQALDWALKGLPLAEQAHDLKTQGRLHYVIGNVHYTLVDYNAARPMLLAALREAKALNDQRIIGATLNGLGNLYQAEKKWPLALRYYQQAVDFARQQGDARSETTNEVNLAEVYRYQGNRAQALRHSRYARALARTRADTYNLSAVELVLARLFLQDQRPDSAIQLARHALDFYQQTGNNGSASAASDILAQAYAQRSNYAQAYRYRNLHIAYQDSLAGEEVQRQTAALRYGYELDKKQAQIALLRKTRQLQAQKSARQRQQLYGLLGGLGGLVLLAGLLWRNVHIKQRANRHLNEKNEHIARQRDDLDHALLKLKATRHQLAQREKMALLGELTAGVAHEIQNPLNFVNNFSEVSGELLEELRQELAKEDLSGESKQSIEELLQDLAQSQQRIQQHGQRAEAIVKTMLEHSRSHAGEQEPTDLNALVEKNLHLAFSGQNADSPDGPITLTVSLDPHLGMVEVVPQDLGRVLLSLFNNALYAVRHRQQMAGPAYQPTVAISTQRLANQVEIRVRDNGFGIPAELTEKIFQPFFTTKPPGKGTGLGLSLSYDIISKSHGGTLTVESREGEFAQFLITLPVAPAAVAANEITRPLFADLQPTQPVSSQPQHLDVVSTSESSGF